MNRGYWKTATGHPVQSAAIASRHPSDFVVGGHLGIVLQVYEAAGRGLLGAGAPARSYDLDGYTAQVLLVDDGRRAPYQVLDGVVVCSATPGTRVRPTPTSDRALSSAQREELGQSGRLPEDLPLEALDGDRCIVQYLGGCADRPYVSAFWPRLLTGAPVPAEGPTVAYRAHHAGLEVRVDSRGTLRVSTEASGTTTSDSVSEDDPDGGGPVVPSLGGDIELALKPGCRIAITSGGVPVLSLAHDGLGPVLELGDRGDRPWQKAVLGGALVEFWNQFRADLIAKLQAVESQFERFYTQEYALHAHGLGPNGTTPPAQPAPNPAQAIFQPASAAPPAAQPPGAQPAEPARTPPDRKTDDATFARMKTYRLLSPVLRLPHPDARPDEEA